MIFRPRKKRIVKTGLVVCVGCLFVFTTRSYLSYRSLARYKALRAEAKSIESSFPVLENALLKAVRYAKNPVFYQELGRLYLERAMAEINFGTADKRESFLDLAQDAFSREIRLNPIDAWAYYDMGKVWMLINYPLLTYAQKGRQYFRKALDFNPANEFLNLNVLFTFFVQWDDLTTEERAFAFGQMSRMVTDRENFLGEFRRRWNDDMKDEPRLREILMEDQDLWEKIKGRF